MVLCAVGSAAGAPASETDASLPASEEHVGVLGAPLHEPSALSVTSRSAYRAGV